MWNQQDQVKNFGKDKRRAEEVSLQIKVSNDGEVLESLEDLTDDEVFKELINIVVDVFSHKSEKCLLTFELPSQSDGLTTVSSNTLCTSDSGCWDRQTDQKLPVCDILSHLKYFETLPSRKSSKHERNLKLPINKPSKHNNKKVLDKRLNPIVQTVLHPKQGFTDLEALVKLRHRSFGRSRWQRCVGKEKHRAAEGAGEVKNIAKEWERQEKAHIPKTSSIDDLVDSNRSSNLYNKFYEFIDKLRMLLDMYDENSHTDSHRIEYHMGEIETHILAITSYLSNRSIIRPSSGEVNDVVPSPKARKVDSFVSRTRARRGDVTVYQIATKKSLMCRSRSHRRRRRKKRSHSGSTKITKGKHVQAKKTDETTMSLEDILKCYQQMKKEETELVKVLLSRLGLTSVERERSHSHKDSEEIQVMTVGRGCQTSGHLYDDGTTHTSQIPEHNELKSPECNKIPQKRTESVDPALEDSSLVGEKHISTALEEPVNPTQKKARVKRRLKAKPLELEREPYDRISCGIRLTKRAIQTPQAQEKQEQPNATSEADRIELPQCCFVPEDIINQYSDVECVQIIKEEKVMSRIQNAAERLEHMQDLVEKKLGYLCKQKELYQGMKSPLTNCEMEQEELKIEDAIEIEELSKNQSSDSQNEEDRVTEASHTTAMKTFPTYVQYPNVNLEESKDFRELLRGFEQNSSRFSNSKGRKTNVSKAENNSQEDQLLRGKSYICNYMMEMRGSEVNDLEGDSIQLQLVSGSENSTGAKDEETNEVPNCMDSTQHQLDVNEGLEENDENHKETPLNPNKSSTHCEIDKTELRIKKKMSGINCPGKSLCTLS